MLLKGEAAELMDAGSTQCSREALVDWIWRYFAGPSASADACRPPSGQHVVQSGESGQHPAGLPPSA